MRKKFIAALTVVASMAFMAPAAAQETAVDEMPTLAEILLSDSAKDDENGFDARSWDYDIVTQAVLLFPDLVAAASNPDAELTAFLPRDGAFRRLVYEISGQWVRSEADVFAAVAGLGVDTVKDVLLYHLVPAKISYRDALGANGAEIPTLLGEETITVKVKNFWFWKFVKLVDNDTNDRNPIVVRPNLGGEASNGYAHGINRVLRPIDLP
ncbi:MAG: fasciclin domain-containing protein [Acidimicrobiia bacterium]|nr:fasciclin domain-containing protein [Acidimicrobiia bacterium]